MLRHPMFDSMRKDSDYSVVEALPNTDKIMNDSFWIGLYPGLDDDAIAFMIGNIEKFLLMNA